jgi:hypothetical protein
MKYLLKHLIEDITSILNGLINTGFTSTNSLEDYFWNDLNDNLSYIPKERREYFEKVYNDKSKVVLLTKLIEVLSEELMQEYNSENSE